MNKEGNEQIGEWSREERELTEQRRASHAMRAVLPSCMVLLLLAALEFYDGRFEMPGVPSAAAAFSGLACRRRASCVYVCSLLRLRLRLFA